MDYTVDHVKWRSNSRDIKKVREQVFVCEFRIPVSTEFDNADSSCDHVLVRDKDDSPIATGRINRNGKISRIAVLIQHRQSDASLKIVKKLLNIAQSKGLTKVSIDSELDDVDKYTRYGFNTVGQVFMDVGVAKQSLTCQLKRFKWCNTILH